MSDTQPTAAVPDPPEDRPETQPSAEPTPPAAPAAAPPAAPPVAQRTRLRDLVFGLRSLVAVGVAGVIVGGVGGYALQAATDDGGGRMGRFGPGPGFRGGPDGGGFPRGGFQGGPGQQLPGQMPPQQAPQQPLPSASPTPSP